MVFLGRSNVGKSSLINRLLGVRGLARTSSTPGRTQSVNFYRINDALYFVDLPGYGYARVPAAIQRQWRPMVEGFLDRCAARIAVAVLVVDARRDPQETDGVMRDWLLARQLRFVIAATKMDKLKRGQAARSLQQLRQAYAMDERDGGRTFPVSSETGDGIGPVWGEIDRALAAGRQAGIGHHAGASDAQRDGQD